MNKSMRIIVVAACLVTVVSVVGCGGGEGVKKEALKTVEAMGPDEKIRLATSFFSAGKIGQAPAPADQAFAFQLNGQGRLSQASEFGDIVVRARSDGSTATKRQRHGAFPTQFCRGEFLRVIGDSRQALCQPLNVDCRIGQVVCDNDVYDARFRHAPQIVVRDAESERIVGNRV